MKEKSILEIWDFLYYIHRVSNNRVAYIRFDVPEEDAQEPPSCPPPEKPHIKSSPTVKMIHL